MVGTGRRTLFLGATAARVAIGREIKSFLGRAEKRRALRAGRNLLRGRRDAAQTKSRNAHQLRQRERERHPRRNQAAGKGVGEVSVILSRGATDGN